MDNLNFNDRAYTETDFRKTSRSIFIENQRIVPLILKIYSEEKNWNKIAANYW